MEFASNFVTISLGIHLILRLIPQKVDSITVGISDEKDLRYKASDGTVHIPRFRNFGT
jgi:hypothetical protein